MKTIVSLTSFPGRQSPVVPTINSILDGTVRPDKIVLYLAEEQYPNRAAPAPVAELAKKEPLFEVRWTKKNLRSYKKLVPALSDFPDDIIITLDDDIIYRPRLVERLLLWHKKHPDCIIAHRAVRVRVRDGKFLPYKKWKLFKLKRYLFQWPRPGFDNMATSGGGTLFPPHCLHSDVMRDDIFMKIAPTTDDLWWWAQAVRAGTKTMPVPLGYVIINDFLRGQGEELRSENVRGDGNDSAIAALSGLYPGITKN
jgi:hypothetical protein